MPGAGAARHRGPRPRRHRLPRQDRHPHRGRHGRHRAARRCGGARRGVRTQGARRPRRVRPAPERLASRRSSTPTRTARTGAAPSRCRSPRPASTAAPPSARATARLSTWLLGAPDVLLAARRPGARRDRPAQRAGPAGAAAGPRPRRDLDDPEVAAGAPPDRAGRPGAAAAPGRRRHPALLRRPGRHAPRSSPATTRCRSARWPASSACPARRHRGRPPAARRPGRRWPRRWTTGTVFGRVTPQQKRDMVGALQSRGHTVAMTGDGVNDVLALKDADIGVAMGSGSEATRAVAQIVLLEQQLRDAAVGGRGGPPGHRQHHPGRHPVPGEDGLLGAAGDPGGRAGRSSTPSCPAT